MVEWTPLFVPILLSAVIVFVLSSVSHMVLKWHYKDYRKLPDEDAVCDVLRQHPLPAGQYIFPHMLGHGASQAAEMAQKFVRGPIGLLYVRPAGPMKIGSFLGKWVLFTIVVAACVAHVARVGLPPGTDAMRVLNLTGTTAWLAYSFGGPADSIWIGKPWAVTGKHMVDGLAYGLGTGAMFAWWWPA